MATPADIGEGLDLSVRFDFEDPVGAIVPINGENLRNHPLVDLGVVQAAMNPERAPWPPPAGTLILGEDGSPPSDESLMSARGDAAEHAPAPSNDTYSCLSAATPETCYERNR